jgi:hypothetical protein
MPQQHSSNRNDRAGHQQRHSSRQHLQFPFPLLVVISTVLSSGLTPEISCAQTPTTDRHQTTGPADSAYYQSGELAGSLRSADPLPLYDPNPEHLWNRLFAAISIRHSNLPSVQGGPPVPRIEGGDTIEFLGWAGTTYWDEPATTTRLDTLLNEFLAQTETEFDRPPIQKVIMQRDLWAAFDFLISQTIARRGSLEVRQRRSQICEKLAQAMKRLALPADALARLPDNYALAVSSGHFDSSHDFDPDRSYLPHDLFADNDTWQEYDFHRPQMSATTNRMLEPRFVFLHTREFRGRSYFRVFCRFPGGREAFNDYLTVIEEQGVDWKKAAQTGVINLKPETPQFPPGTEFILLQYLIALDTDLNPVPTSITESVRLMIHRNVTGEDDPATSLKQGTNVLKYTLKRRLAFAEMQNGGLQREPNDWPVYRVIFESGSAVDWGPRGRQFSLADECLACHSDRGQSGVHMTPSLVNSGGLDSGAQLGIVHTIPHNESPHAQRTARFKSIDETYRRLLDYLRK